MAGELSSGQIVGPYRLLFRLGKGGMGEVWAAHKTGQFGFERLVALKLLRGVSRDSNAAVMFFDEGRAAAQLQHTAIVPTFDLGQYGETFYIAMGLIGGPSLTALLQHLAVRKTPVAPSVVAYMGERLAAALDYAYDRAEVDGKKLRLVHRDISPHNVLLDLQGNVHLSDFGVARTAVQDHESRVGTVRGKPSYMAPEQVQGQPMDARTDVFALGIVLYESACVKRLFGRSNPVKSMEAVVHYEPKPLPTLVPDFPEPLWRVIARCLEKDPNRRFATAGELSRALSDLARTLPATATGARDLAQLIEDVFPSGSFDLDARVRAALEASAAQEEPLERTRYEQRRSSQASGSLGLRSADLRGAVMDQAFAEPIGTSAWPAAQAGPEPLDPSVLEDLQAQMVPATFGPTGSGSMPSFQQSYPQVTGTHSSTTPARNQTMLAAVVGGAAVALAGLALVTFTSRGPTPIPTLAAPVPPQPTEPAAVPEIGARTAQAEPPRGASAPTVSSGPGARGEAPAPVRGEAPSRGAPSASPERRPVIEAEPRRPVASAAPVPAPSPAAPVVGKGELVRLIKTIGDPGKKNEFMVKLTETPDEPAALGALWTEVRRELDAH